MGVKLPIELFLEYKLESPPSPAQLEAFHADLCGKVIAIDAAQILFEALSVERQGGFKCACGAKSPLLLCMTRGLQLVRYGAHPVFVLDGRAPAAKDKTRCARRGGTYAGQSIGSNPAFEARKREMEEILRATGLPCIRAPGEGEAMCAALNARGLADAVLSTDITDVLIFGGRRVLAGPKLDFLHPHNAQGAVLSIETLRGKFGLEAGGDEVLTAIAIIVGSDYNPGGLQKAGPDIAIESMPPLLTRFAAITGRSDDVGFLDFLAAELAAPLDEELTTLTACTGCMRCGHENKAARKTHGESACAECVKLGHDGPGCLERPGERCSCRFHATEQARKAERLKRLAQAVDPETGTPFHQRLRAVTEHFADERRRARAAAAALTRAEMLWHTPPDAAWLQSLLESQGFVHTTKNGHDEVLSCVAHFHVEFAKRAGEASAGCMYTLKAVKKVKPSHKPANKGLTAGTTLPSPDAVDWQYLTVITPLNRGALEQPLQSQWAAYDKAKALSSESNRTVMISMVQQRWPGLEAAFQAAKGAKAAKAAARARPKAPVAHDAAALQFSTKKGAAASAAASASRDPWPAQPSLRAAAGTAPGGSKLAAKRKREMAAVSQSRSIDTFFRPQSASAAAPAAEVFTISSDEEVVPQRRPHGGSLQAAPPRSESDCIAIDLCASSDDEAAPASQRARRRLSFGGEGSRDTGGSAGPIGAEQRSSGDSLAPVRQLGGLSQGAPGMPQKRRKT